jgi:putative hydrolase of the HAD superfamily
MLRAILFDLDDTLFDHHHCAREALTAVYESDPVLAAMAFDEFERAHADHLETLHTEVLAGSMGIDEARIERFRRLLVGFGGDAAAARAAAAAYRAGYVAARRAIPGAASVLARLRRRVRIGVVSNNLLAEQQEKLRQCALDRHVDALVVSEEVGISKPDPEIFRVALERLGVARSDALMVGDSWSADILGARAAGIPVVWFNPRRLSAPDAAVRVPELRALQPTGPVVRFLRCAHAHAARD